MSTGVLARGRPAVDPAPMDPRVRARRIEVERDRARTRFRRLLALVVVTVVALGAVGLTRSALLDVDRIRVTGATRQGPDAVRQAAGIAIGRALVTVDPGVVEARLEREPWVASARVTRQWPGTLVVAVTERVPVATVGRGAATALVDRDGRILGPATGDEALPSVGTATPPAAGDRLAADRRRLVAVLADLPTALRDQVASGTVRDGGLGLVLRDGIRVDLGDGTRLRARSEAVLAVLDQAGRATVATVDASVVGTVSLTRNDPEGA